MYGWLLGADGRTTRGGLNRALRVATTLPVSAIIHHATVRTQSAAVEWQEEGDPATNVRICVCRSLYVTWRRFVRNVLGLHFVYI